MGDIQLHLTRLEEGENDSVLDKAGKNDNPFKHGGRLNSSLRPLAGPLQPTTG